MKKCLILLADYHPHDSSNSSCFEQYINYMIDKKIQVNVLTIANDFNDLEFEILDDVYVYRLINKRVANSRKYYSQKNRNNLIFKLLTTIYYAFTRSYYRLFHVYNPSEPRYIAVNLKKYYKKLYKLQMEKNFDFIISISYPNFTHLIANDFKVQFPNVKWCVFEYDPFSYNDKYQEKYFKSNIEKEHKIYQNCDIIMVTQELFSFYDKTPFKIYKNKMKAVNFNCGIVNSRYIDNSLSLIEEKDKINLYYGGAFDSKIRNPEYFFKILNESNTNISLTLLTNCDLNLYPNYTTCHTRIKKFDQQPKNVALSTMLDADILISIGNTIEYGAPGKTLEYISTGKPIIHFSKVENDSAIKYFNGYDNVLIIKEYENSLETNIYLFNSFCLKPHNLIDGYKAINNNIFIDKKNESFIEGIEKIISEEDI